MVDEYFRQFSGHTQVNATDLRNLKYPSLSQLMAMGEKIGDEFPEQDEIDQVVLETLEMDTVSTDVKAKKKIREALDILRAIRVPKAHMNQRSALTLLALLDMKPETDWCDASAISRGITEMMDYFRDHFGISCAPNTCGAVQQHSIVHHFVRMGLVIADSDDTAEPAGSQKTKYRIDDDFLNVIRACKTRDRDKSESPSEQRTEIAEVASTTDG